MLITRFELLTSMYSSGKSTLATVAPLSQELTHVSTDCPLISHVRSENGVAIERTWTATVLSLVIWVNREQRPYISKRLLLLLRFYRTVKVREDMK